MFVPPIHMGSIRTSNDMGPIGDPHIPPKTRTGSIWAPSWQVMIWVPNGTHNVRPNSSYRINVGTILANYDMGLIYDPLVRSNITYGIKVDSIREISDMGHMGLTCSFQQYIWDQCGFDQGN